MEIKEAIGEFKAAINKAVITQYGTSKFRLSVEALTLAIEALQKLESGLMVELPIQRPKIVCLCGSTRFFKTFDEMNYKLTLAGEIVLSIGSNTKSDDGLKLTADDKKMLDELHKRKIDLCDYVYVLNVGGYIGESTRSEIEYALTRGKPVKYREAAEVAKGESHE